MEAIATFTTFDSTKDSLQNLLRNIHDGKMQLPDFQRGWTWDDAHICGLLASISLGYPIGVVMLLETGNSAVRFQPRPIEGVTDARNTGPERLILDGQQRLTSLYLALCTRQPVATRDARGKSIRRWYYMDIAKALDSNADREEAIVSLPEDKKQRNFRGEIVVDYSTIEQECAAGMFPMDLVFDIARQNDWMMHYLQMQPDSIQERLTIWNDFLANLIHPFQQYQVPLIVLKKETPKGAICQVFEKVNTGGVALNVFELLTATYAADDFRLRPDWEARSKTLYRHRVLEGVEDTYFLQCLTLVSTYLHKRRSPETAVSCKRKDILDLPLDEYQTLADGVVRGFEKAAKFLHMQHIFAARDVPYTTQLVPLAAMLVVLGERADEEPVRAKLERWFWCGVFGELYGGATETRFAKDLPEVVDWVEGRGSEPITIIDAHFAPVRLYSLRTRNSAAYKGISALLLRDGANDFRTGTPVDVAHFFEHEHIDIHHIFPQPTANDKSFPKGSMTAWSTRPRCQQRPTKSSGGKRQAPTWRVWRKNSPSPQHGSTRY